MNSQSEIVQGISKKWELTKQKKYIIRKRSKKTHQQHVGDHTCKYKHL